MDRSEFELLSAGNATSSLDPVDQAAFDAALAEHPEWASIVEADLETVAMLGEATARIAPPAGMLASILDALPAQDEAGVTDAALSAPEADVPSTIAEVAPRSSARRERSRRRSMFVLAAAITLIVAGGITAAVVSPMLATPASVVALERIETAPDAQSAAGALADGTAATLHWSLEAGTAVLVSDDMPMSETDSTYELWIIRDGEPVSAGTFDSASRTAPAVIDGVVHEGDTIAVTVEQRGGAPDGTPTTDPILAIPVQG